MKWLALAVFTAVSGLYFGLLAYGVFSESRIQDDYRDRARLAMADGDVDTARFLYSRLVGAGQQGPEQDQLNWATLLDAAGETDAATRQLDRLAPADRDGYRPAHLLQAKRLLGRLRVPGVDRDETLRVLEHHLRVGAYTQTVENHLLWGQYHLAAQSYASAVDRFSRAADNRPTLWVDVARLYLEADQRDEASTAMAK